MRWAPHVGWMALCAATIPTSCSSNGAVADAGTDAFVSIPCTSSAGCPAGTQCLYPAADGCSATPHCLPSGGTACKPMFACSCTGTTVGVCNGGASAPVRSLGACQVGCGGACASCLACELCDVSGYTPTPMSTPVASKNACSPTEISDFVTACYGTSATQQTCDAWKTAEADAGSCLSCVFTAQSAAAWGAFVCTSISCSPNTPGCVDLELGQISQEKQAGGSGSCGDLLDASYGCQDYACGTCSGTDIATCTNSAVQNECKNYVDTASNSPACAALEADAATAKLQSCFPQSDTGVLSFVNVFCGSGP